MGLKPVWRNPGVLDFGSSKLLDGYRIIVKHMFVEHFNIDGAMNHIDYGKALSMIVYWAATL